MCRVGPGERGQGALNGSESVKIREATGAAIKRVLALEVASAESSLKWDEYGAGSGAGRGSYYPRERVLSEEYPIAG